jgi:hypothetical protein
VWRKDQAVIQKIENGVSIRTSKLCEIAIALGVAPEYLEYGVVGIRDLDVIRLAEYLTPLSVDARRAYVGALLAGTQDADTWRSGEAIS